MRARRSLRRAALALAAGAVASAPLLLASCQDPTQISVLVRTNVPYRPNVTMALWSSAGGQIAPGTSPQAVYREPWLSDGQLGDLVITPSGAKDGPVTLQAVLGIDRDPTTCTDKDAKGCVVTRRKLAFVPHTRLRVPLVLHLACDGVVCSQDTTCDYLGKCVAATVDPDACASPAGCTLPGDETVKPSSSATSSGAAPAPPPDAVAPKSVRVSAGYDHSCAVRDGALKCWGGNTNGILGLGDTLGRGAGPGQMGAALPAVDLGPGRSVAFVAASNNHTCALLDDLTVKCWGANTSGLLGLGDARPRGGLPGEMGGALPAVNAAPGRTLSALAAGNDHTCVLFQDGNVKCWGLNIDGRLGLGDVAPRGGSPAEMGTGLPVVDLGGRTAISLAVGNNHTCVVLDDARVKCWGGNEDGQLGLGDTNRRGASPGQMGAALSPVDLGGRPAARVAVGNKFSCAILVDGGVVCWGRNTYGQLGTGDRTSRGRAPGEMGTALPTLNLGAGRTVKQVGLGDNHVCARLDNGAVKCWGRNSSKGELGLGDTSDRGGQPGDLGDTLPAVNLGAARTAVDLAVGLRHTCAALDNGAVKCWGENSLGQLGQGNTTDLGASPGQMGDALKPVPLD